MKYYSETYLCPVYKKSIIVTVAYDDSRQRFNHKGNELYRFCKSRDKCNVENCPVDLNTGELKG